MGRAPCCDKTNVKRGPWSPEEDATLKNYLKEYGTGGNWISLPQKAGLRRCGKSCRLRWLNYLRPDIKHGAFSEDEDNTIISMYYQMGSRWSVIAANLPGRTDNDVKNYWNTRLKKKVFGGTNINKFTPAIIPNTNNHATFTNNNIITKPILQNPSNDSITSNNNPIYVPNPSFSDYLAHCTASNPMSMLPNFANAYANDPFSIPNSTHNYPFMSQASSSITNGDNVNVLPYEEVSSASGSSSVVYGSRFEDDPFFLELGYGVMQEEVMMNNNPICNFDDVGQEDNKPQGLGQEGVTN